MATTTTNYGFDIPQSTDLVKDGATAIATLGQDIDTAMNTALGTKKAGMVLLNTTSFSAVASQSVNDVFTTSYDNYRILIAIDSTTATSQQVFQIKLRASGTDKSTAYDYNLLRQFTTNVSYANASNQTSFVIGYLSTNINGTSFFTLDICDPKISKATRMFVNSTYGADSVRDMQTGGCVQTENYQADGFTISIAANAVTGRVSTYGYNK